MQKEAKGQLAAQATAEAYHASARLPGQGNELCLMPYTVLLHAPTQLAIIKTPGRNISGSLFLMPHGQDTYFLMFAPIPPVCRNG